MRAWKPDVVCYHHPCPDGFTAYWILHNVFGGDFTPMPCNYGGIFDFEACRDKRVLFADFSLKKPDLLKLINDYGAEVVILDHHESAEKELADFVVPLDVRPDGVVGHGHRCAAWFDMKRSGAGLTWDWCWPGTVRPTFVNFVEARDLWTPELLGTHADYVMPCAAYVRMFPKTLDAWDKLEAQFEFSRRQVFDQATAIWQYHNALVDDVAAKAELETIAGHQVPTVNCTYELGSDVAHRLLALHPEAPFVAYYVVAPEKGTGRPVKFYGLRSEDKRLNVAEVAASLGGGGHRNASGFRQALA